MSTQKRTEDLIKQDHKHVIHGFASPGGSTQVIFEEGHGMTLKDTTGREYIDFHSGVVNVNVGHTRRELVQAAVAQMAKLDYAVTFREFSHTAVIECANKLEELMPEGLDHYYFCSGGAEANEIAFKAVRFYWRTKGKDKFKIISINNSFHGLTCGAMSATMRDGGSHWRRVGPLAPGFLHIPNFDCYHCAFGLSYPDCDTRCARFLVEIIESEGEDSIAAFIAEPVQGTGLVAPPPTYWPVVRQICTEHNVLLIADEVMTGFGRTGKLFAVDHWNVRPDIMTLGKGITSGHLPLAAVALTEEIFKGVYASDAPFPAGFTYSGHPVCCAVATANMEILVKENLVENAARMGKHIMHRLSSEFMEFNHVGNINGLGLMCGIELVADKATRKKFDPAKAVGAQTAKRIREAGILVRLSSGDRIGLAPPLNVTIEEVDRVLDTLKPIIASI